MNTIANASSDPGTGTGTVTFKSLIKMRGINPYVHVEAAQANALRPGWKRPMPVQFRINGAPRQSARISLMPVGDGSFYLYLDQSVREIARVEVGEIVEVSATFDPGYRGGPADDMPKLLQDALSADPKVAGAWQSLAPSLQKEILRYLANLKSQDAKHRNVEKTLRVLAGERMRFLARSWNEPVP